MLTNHFGSGPILRHAGVSVEDPPPQLPIPQTVINCYRQASEARTAYLAAYLSQPNPSTTTPHIPPSEALTSGSGTSWRCRDPNTNFVYTRPEPCAKGDIVLSKNESLDAISLVEANGVYKVPENVQDVISVMYYARNINYNEYKAGDKIPFSMFMDDKVYYIYIHYIGKETVKTKYGKFNAIKLKPLLLKGNIFDGGEKMTIWITDDANHIPVRVESPIAVGSVKIDLMHYENLKYPLSVL